MTLTALRVGSGRPDYVFIHGLFGQGKNFSAIAKALAPATSLLVDLPNHGRSSWRDSFDYDEIAAEVADLLRSGGAAEKPVTLVGHSLGGKVVMRLALVQPDLVRRLVVVDMSPVAAGVGESPAYARAMQGLDLATVRTRRDADEALHDAILDDRVRAFLLQNLRHDESGWRWGTNLDVLTDAMDTIGGWPATDGFTPYEGPVLWIGGALSDYIRPEYADAMRALFPKVRLVTIKDARHWVHADQPAVFTDVLKQFVART